MHAITPTFIHQPIFPLLKIFFYICPWFWFQETSTKLWIYCFDSPQILVRGFRRSRLVWWAGNQYPGLTLSQARLGPACLGWFSFSSWLWGRSLLQPKINAEQCRSGYSKQQPNGLCQRSNSVFSRWLAKQWGIHWPDRRVALFPWIHLEVDLGSKSLLYCHFAYLRG